MDERRDTIPDQKVDTTLETPQGRSPFMSAISGDAQNTQQKSPIYREDNDSLMLGRVISRTRKREVSPVALELKQMGLRVSAASRSAFESRMDPRRMARKGSHLWDEQLAIGAAITVNNRNYRRAVPWYIILPGSGFRVLWDAVIVLLMLYTVIYLPFKIGFGTKRSWDSVDLAVDLLFLVDIVVSFFLAYETDEGTTITDHRKIVRKYIATWFGVDLVAAFPFSLLGYAALDRYTEGLKAVKLLRMIKLLRLYRLKAWYHWLEHHPKMHRPTLKLSWFMITLFSFSYLAGCLWHFIGTLDEGDDNAWVKRAFGNGIEHRKTGYKVLVSMYWSLTTLTTIGYGDISAETTPELVFSLVIMLCGASLYSFVTASAIHILKKTDASQERLKIDQAILAKFGKDAGMDQLLLQRSMSNLKSRHFASQKSAESVWPVLEKLSPEIQREICMFVNQDLLKNCPFFIKFAKHLRFVRELMSVARPGMAYPGEFIMNQGDQCTHFYIMRAGTVNMVFSQYRDLKLTPLSLHDVFGHEIILVTGQAICNFLCVVETHFIRIETRAFLQTLSRYPERFKDINALAEERVKSITKQLREYRSKRDSLHEAKKEDAAMKLRDELRKIQKSKPSLPSSDIFSNSSAWRQCHSFMRNHCLERKVIYGFT